MRIRHKPWARPELEACPFYVPQPHLLRGCWQSAFSVQRPICMDLGCGKGVFLSHAALQDQQRNWIGVDIASEVLVWAKRNIDLQYGESYLKPENVQLCIFEIALISQIISREDAVELIHIGFPNPWPKPKHHKRRLTHPRQLIQYRDILNPGGQLIFRTDDEQLYAHTLKYFEQTGFTIVERSADFYSDFPDRKWDAGEYEIRYIAQGGQIRYIRALN